METTQTKINGKDFLILELEPVNQKDKIWYLAKIKASDLLSTYTVRPAKYDFKSHKRLASDFEDDSEYYNHLITLDKENLEEKDFQREPNTGRVKDIKDFLNEQEFAFFPNTIIATCDLINDQTNIDLDESTSLEEIETRKINLEHFSFFFIKDSKPHLLVPNEESSILVIDGQHRLTGLENAKKEVQENYEMLVAFIIGFDRSVVAKQFYTINYEQKPVNKSLLYQLTGEFSQDVTELSFLHNVVKIMNELEASPFHNRVKMLGVKPKTAADEERRLLSISQAFLVDWLLKTLNSNTVGSINSPIFLYYYRDKKMHIQIIRFIMRYFNAVKSLRNDWDKPEESILSMGLGVGALINTMQLLFVKIFVDECILDPEKIINYSEADLITKLEGIENVDFSKEGEFGKTSGASTISNIKESIIINIKYFKANNYSSFKDEHTKEGGALEKYKNWLKEQLENN